MIWPVGAQNSQTITSNLCPPASPIDPTLDPDNPDYTGIATFGNQITLDYYSAPGVHSYRAWYRPIDLIDVDPNQRIECNIPVDPCLPLASYTFDVNIPQGAVTNFCQIGRTIRFPVPDGQQPYRVYLESLCCPANSVATCDNQMNLSDCYLVADSAPACTMDDQQIITTTVLSSTQIEIGWLDQIIADTEYIIRAEPINCNNNEPAFMEVFIGNPNPNNIHEFTLNELLPNTNYNITVSKNCSGVLCSGCTIDISVQESTQDLGQLTITEVCNNMLAEIRIPLETINNTPPPYNFILAGEPSLPTWWDAQTNEYVIGGVRAGSFTLEIEECSFLFWPVTINEDLDCLIANIGACGTMVNEEIDLDSENLITNIVNSNDYNIPHQWQGDKLILENLKLHFYGQSNLVLDSNVEFRNCEIYMESGNQMEVQLLLFLTENTIIDKCNGGNWEGLIMHSGSSLFMTNSSMLGAKTAISYNTSIEEISIFGKSNFVTSTIEAANGIISSGPSDAIANIINVTGSSLNLSDNSGIQLRALDVYISSSQIIGARRAISIRNALNVDIVNGCIINSIATAVSIITSSGNVNLSNNSSILSEENTAISINTSNVTIASNDQIQSGGGQPAISGLDWTSCDISTNFNITGSVEIDGVANETNLFFNKIISPTNGIDLQEADNAILRCNDITSINNSINLSSNCMYTDLFGNVLNFGSENDLFSEQSTFIQVPDDNGNIMHRGNCFRGEYVKSSFSDPVFLAESIFYVDTVEQDCFEPKYGSLELFSIDLNPESTQQCPALFINSFMYYNETEICTSLRNIEKLLNDTNLSQVGILRLLNLLKQIRENEMVMPSCIRSFLDTTSYCSFNMYEKFHDIQTDRNDLLLDYQIQSTITQLYLKLWQSYDSLVSGNSTEQKNLLYEKYLVAKSVLLDLAQQIQRENQDIHNYVNNSTFSTCLDSLSVMKRNVLSLKYKQSTFSNSEKNYILSQARLCSRRYGYVIHEFRAIARQFSEEDFSGYDDCVITRGGTRDRSTNINESIRTKIIPNPAATEFQVISSSFEITKINIYSLEGNIVYQSLANGMKHNINSSKLSPGIYFIKIIYDNQSSDLQKLIIH